MAYTPGNPGTKLDKNFENDLLAIADTKLVLGNWYAECTMNGRSLPDFAAILGMCTANYGHTRAIYQYLAAHGHDYDYLERGRGPEDICSSNLLDEAPAGWEDFIVSTWLAELSTWMLASGFLKHEDRAVAGITKKIGEETYFHLKYSQGWFQILGEGKKQSQLSKKLSPTASRWHCSGSVRRAAKTRFTMQVSVMYHSRNCATPLLRKPRRRKNFLAPTWNRKNP